MTNSSNFVNQPILDSQPIHATDPRPQAARVASRIERAMDGRKVDVVLKAPNLLELPIHRIAEQEGVRL